MRAIQVQRLDGPDGLVVADLPEPDGDAPLLVEVRAAGVGFPDLLMSRGEYQIRQEPPFTLGWEASGVVARAPEDSVLEPGDRVVTLTFGAFAERIAAVPQATFALPDTLSFEEGAAYPLNYLTAIAGLKRRGRLAAGESVLVQGAAGGVGTAAIQVAKALGARVIGLVSTEAKAQVARAAGADEVVLAVDGWRDRVLEISDGGVNVVYDPVGGERFLDGLRCLRSEGRLVVIGFAEGAIPEVKVNRLLLRNIDVCGASFGVLGTSPGGFEQAADDLAGMVAEGFVRPVIGERYPLEDAGRALRSLAERRSTGKPVLVL